MNRTKAFFAMSSVLVVAFTLAAASNPKTTGDSGWLNAGNQAHTVFNAIATSPTGPGAKGSFLYDDGPNVYSMDVKWLIVSGNTAWFAGEVTVNNSGCCAVGHWIFIKIVDNGEPGIGTDQIWGEDLGNNPAGALAKVLSQATPAGGPFTINAGNMQVHK